MEQIVHDTVPWYLMYDAPPAYHRICEMWSKMIKGLKKGFALRRDCNFFPMDDFALNSNLSEHTLAFFGVSILDQQSVKLRSETCGNGWSIFAMYNVGPSGYTKRRIQCKQVEWERNLKTIQLSDEGDWYILIIVPRSANLTAEKLQSEFRREEISNLSAQEMTSKLSSSIKQNVSICKILKKMQ
jgi:hypothetical protein